MQYDLIAWLVIFIAAVGLFLAARWIVRFQDTKLKKLICLSIGIALCGYLLSLISVFAYALPILSFFDPIPWLNHPICRQMLFVPIAVALVYPSFKTQRLLMVSLGVVGVSALAGVSYHWKFGPKPPIAVEHGKLMPPPNAKQVKHERLCIYDCLQHDIEGMHPK